MTPMTIRPAPPAACGAKCGRSTSSAAYIASEHKRISGTKYSCVSYFSLTTAIPTANPAMMAS
jgi:hypothetical protein